MLVALLMFVMPAVAGPPRPRPPPADPQQQTSDPWAAMLERATPAVLSIDIVATRAFDTENARHSYATGFVVDAARGIVLTNRHVVTPGPVRSEAITQENEVIPLRAIYRDPVHDFGFYQYDPAAVKYSRLPALELDPAGVRIGQEIRVVGNNAGEKLSIHTGTIARLDREAPRYGRDSFNDFNTFYIQAAAGTTGGSSGSPVLDLRGKVVALNAGARKDSAASYYLPLDRVQRALELVQANLPVTRGTVQAVFGAVPWDELARLGLPPEEEAAARARRPTLAGLLGVKEVLPLGPGDGRLRVGDIVLTLDGRPVDAFVPLEEVLDERVGGTVLLGLQRADERVEVEVPVGDLHAITPSSYMEVGGGLVHTLSFQQARNANVPVRGVYVASAGYSLGQAGVPDGARVDEVNGHPTPDLAHFRDAVLAISDEARVPVHFVTLTEPNRTQVVSWRMERTFFPAQTCTRDDTTGGWPCVGLPAPPAAPPPVPQAVSLPPAPPGVAGKVAHALVWVEARLPFVLSGNAGDQYSGVGLVLDAERGLVVVDRDTVPQLLAEISVIVGAVRVSAVPIYVHPEHNLVVIQFDPGQLTGSSLTSARLQATRVATGTAVWQVGLNGRLEYSWGETVVHGYRPLVLSPPSTPQYRDLNLDVLATAAPPLDRGGVVVNRAGEVVAFLGSFHIGSGKSASASFYGLPSDILAEVARALAPGRRPPDRSLGVAWSPLPLAVAVDRGLLAGEAAALVKAGALRVLMATHVARSSAAYGVVKEGDLLLAVRGKPTSSWRTLELAVADVAVVNLTLFRAGQLLVVDVPTSPGRGALATRALYWAGAIVEDLPPELALQQGIGGGGVYVSWRWFGTPADRYELAPTCRITAVDGRAIATLSDFEAAVAGRADRSTVRLSVLDLDDRARLLALRLDLAYWPSAVIERTETGWIRRPAD
ncbi:MAG: hypothetical protein EXR71_06460 [Myxococcales bacterium]|nr:hypothetical protein [Myxococcales bacterium]